MYLFSASIDTDTVFVANILESRHCLNKIKDYIISSLRVHHTPLTVNLTSLS